MTSWKLLLRFAEQALAARLARLASLTQNCPVSSTIVTHPFLTSITRSRSFWSPSQAHFTLSFKFSLPHHQPPHLPPHSSFPFPFSLANSRSLYAHWRLPQPSTKLSTKLLKNSPFYSPWAPPGGWSGRHLLARLLWPSRPSTYVSAKLAHWQLRKSTFYTLGVPPWWKIWAPPGGKVAMAYPNHPPKYQPTNSQDDRQTYTHAPL